MNTRTNEHRNIRDEEISLGTERGFGDEESSWALYENGYWRKTKIQRFIMVFPLQVAI